MSKDSLKLNQVKNQFKNRRELENVRQQPFFSTHKYKEKKDYEK